ncbi:hypothetical protein [Leuconostoc citreum]
MRLKKVLQNFSLTILSNLLSLIISTIVILIVPKIIGVYEYGLWQLFIFYSSYVGILHFGWLDGIYLRYGGKNYEDLDKKLFQSQFLFLLGSQVFFSVVVGLVSYLLLDGDIKNIMYSVSIIIVVVNMKMYFQFILQMTNKIVEYAISNFISIIAYASILILMLIAGTKDYRFFIFSYIVGQIGALLYCLIVCKELVFTKLIIDWGTSYNEIKSNLVVGIKLVLSNIAGMLIIGIVRFGIQRGWNVVTFGKVSLVLSISNLLMIFVGSISLVLFPILKRINVEQIDDAYNSLKNMLMPLIFLGILVYFPINTYIPLWLPKYNSALVYMSILFPMVAYQAKFEVLSNTFLKVLRMEKQLMLINILTLIMSLILTSVSVGLFHNLSLTILVIVLVMAMRSILSEWYIGQHVDTSFSYEILIETTVVGIFIASTWSLSSTMALIIYSITIVFYLLLKFRSIITAIKYVRNI